VIRRLPHPGIAATTAGVDEMVGALRADAAASRSGTATGTCICTRARRRDAGVEHGNGQ